MTSLEVVSIRFSTVSQHTNTVDVQIACLGLTALQPLIGGEPGEPPVLLAPQNP